ncbi:MAG TPA: hypothetical protein VMV91_16460 [Rhodocyclaceae bacterium]|nr:hypothetical protein [Rhodocyclaceae bacterium]
MTIYALGDRRPDCAPDAWVADNATVIGQVVLQSEASVWFGVVIRGDNDLITIGSRSNVQDNAVLHTDAEVAALPGYAEGYVARSKTFREQLVIAPPPSLRGRRPRQSR